MNISKLPFRMVVNGSGVARNYKAARTRALVSGGTTMYFGIQALTSKDFSHVLMNTTGMLALSGVARNELKIMDKLMPEFNKIYKRAMAIKNLKK